MQTELESLQNWATRFSLTVIEYFQEDKRKTTRKYFLVDSEKISISPVLDYESLCFFLNGYSKAIDTVIGKIIPVDMKYIRK